jgi:hypothetical protein
LLALDMERLGIRASSRINRAGKTVKDKNDNAGEIIAKVLTAINSQSSVKYAPASDIRIRNPRNPKIMLVWIIPERKRKALEQALHTREVVWDLPVANRE